uniref:Tetraspanin-33 n=1 Tax=Sinocyclocheilus rhinocerous TaxID=307959 RepID=A0A673GBZ7_9TELE
MEIYLVARLYEVSCSQTRDALGKFVKKAIVHYRDDLDLQNLMDYIQKEFKCCGWNNYTDWSWNLYFNCTPSNPSTERCAVPFSCCTPLPGETVINTMCGFGIQTQNHLDATKSIYLVGCADRAVIWIESHLLLVGALTLGLALPQVKFMSNSKPNSQAKLYSYNCFTLSDMKRNRYDLCQHCQTFASLF